MAIALVLPFALGKLLQDVYPAFIHQTIGDQKGLSIHHLEFKSGWFSSHAKFEVHAQALGQTLQVSDHLRHLPLFDQGQFKPVIVRGHFQATPLLNGSHLAYALKIDRSIEIDTDLAAGSFMKQQQSWGSGQSYIHFDPAKKTYQTLTKLGQFSQPGFKTESLRFETQGQHRENQSKASFSSLNIGQSTWQNAQISVNWIDQKNSQLSLSFQAENFQSPIQQCHNIQAEILLMPAPAELLTKLHKLLSIPEDATPLQRQLYIADNMRQALPGFLASNPVLQVKSFAMQCDGLQDSSGHLSVQLNDMPLQKISQKAAWLQHVQVSGLIQSDPQLLRNWNLPVSQYEDSATIHSDANGIYVNGRLWQL